MITILYNIEEGNQPQFGNGARGHAKDANDYILCLYKGVLLGSVL